MATKPPTDDPRRMSDFKLFKSSLPIEVVRDLSVIRPARGIATIAREWLTIAAAIAISEWAANPFVTVLAVIVIGARMLAIGVLMHESVHFRLHPNRTVNDVIGTVFLAWPVLFSMFDYRRSHLAHHRNLNGDEDPDWQYTKNPEWDFPKTPLQLAWLLGRNLLGYGLVNLWRLTVHNNESAKRFGYTSASDPRWAKWGRPIFYLVAIAALTAVGGWEEFLLYWVLPAITWQQAIAHGRMMAEHYALPHDHPLRGTRTTVVGPLAAFFLIPGNINYHIEHHFYPSVPFYNLPRLHAALMETEAYRKEAHVTRGYWALLKECTTTRQAAGVSTSMTGRWAQDEPELQPE